LKRKLNLFWYCQRDYAYKYFYVDANLQLTKQACYMCGRLVELSTLKYDANIIDGISTHFGLTLLSDNIGLIMRYADLTHSNYEMLINKGWSSAYNRAIQSILKDDILELERVLQILKVKSVKKYKCELDVLFFEALVNKDKSKCEEILQQMVTPKEHNRRNKDEIGYKEFISFPATTLAKLAWIKGINVQVDTNLIPLALLPLEPNEKYIDEYDFMSGI